MLEIGFALELLGWWAAVLAIMDRGAYYTFAFEPRFRYAAASVLIPVGAVAIAAGVMI